MLRKLSPTCPVLLKQLQPRPPLAAKPTPPPQTRSQLTFKPFESFSGYNVSLPQTGSFARKGQINKEILLGDIGNVQKRADATLGVLRVAEIEKMKSQVQSAIADATKPKQLEWYPANIKEAHKMGKTLMPNKGNENYPQFKDALYKQRRDQIASIAFNYQIGQRIPDIAYSPQESLLWQNLYKKLTNLHNQHCSHRFLQLSQQMGKEFNMTNRIPQMQQLSEFVHSRTGFRMRPTVGELTSRDFLNMLAFKLFCATQYIRNVNNPDFTPEPDIVHEYLGHLPMFADPEVAEISHQIGLMSLGASDADIRRLSALYWFTIQFGVCREDGQLKAYGAGIASSAGEINNFVHHAKFKKLEPMVDCDAPYETRDYQPLYRVTESFEQALRDIQIFNASITKPVQLSYNPLTGEIESSPHPLLH